MTHPKKTIYTHLAQVAKAMASPGRLELLETLAQGERNVDSLAQACGLSIANTSHHLQTLRAGGMVNSRRDGLQIIYRLADDEIPKLLSILGRLAQRQVAEVEQLIQENFDGRDGFTPVKRNELLRLLQKGEAIVIDVRPESEYSAGHISGAINIPIGELPQRLQELRPEQEIIAYCRGPYCLYAVEAVLQLRENGYSARRLEDGFPEWKADKLPIEGKQ